jgi:hypothetical protein
MAIPLLAVGCSIEPVAFNSLTIDQVTGTWTLIDMNGSPVPGEVTIYTAPEQSGAIQVTLDGDDGVFVIAADGTLELRVDGSVQRTGTWSIVTELEGAIRITMDGSDQWAGLVAGTRLGMTDRVGNRSIYALQ